MMKHILILGAGRSSYFLIEYLAKAVQENNWQIILADADPELLAQKLAKYPQITGEQLNVFNIEKTSELVQKADIVVSLLPASLQAHIAQFCLDFSTHLVTASYLPQEMHDMADLVADKSLVFLNEIGLDPGIDHMSAMQIIDQLRQEGAEIRAFRSFAGGLVAPQSDDNPWHYKFTWNPRNVVLAGQGEMARFLENHQLKFVPYSQLFRRLRPIEIEGYGLFDAYPNRNSLKYQKAYGLQDVATILRGTLRRPGFSQAWRVLVDLGFTDNQQQIEDLQHTSYRDFTKRLLPNLEPIAEECFAKQSQIALGSPEFDAIKWLGLFDEEDIGLHQATPAQILQTLLEKKWAMQPEDQDMVVMQHQIDYTLNGEDKQLVSEMVVIGDNAQETAIAKTVGLPLAIATKLILQDKIKTRGVCIPILPEIYAPILEELKNWQIRFHEKVLVV